MLIKILPNMLAMICSLIAIIMLVAAATKIGGIIGRVINLLVTGIFLSVTVHAGFELVEALGFLTERQLMPVMGMLLSGGSVFFAASALLVLKKLK